MPSTNLCPIPKNIKDLTGQKFGRLTIIGFSILSKWWGPCWISCCECGRRHISQEQCLKSKPKTICNCKDRKASNIAQTHSGALGDANFVEYRCWWGMLTRCYNKNNPKYKYYGGRGISMCERWRNSFPNFLADMKPKPSPELSIDRINNDGNYEPGNCRWATRSQQARNTTRKTMTDSDISLAIKLRRQGKKLKEIASLIGVGLSTISEATRQSALR